MTCHFYIITIFDASFFFIYFLSYIWLNVIWDSHLVYVLIYVCKSFTRNFDLSHLCYQENLYPIYISHFMATEYLGDNTRCIYDTEAKAKEIKLDNKIHCCHDIKKF